MQFPRRAFSVVAALGCLATQDARGQSIAVYGITPEGDLEWSVHRNATLGGTLSEPVVVGRGWDVYRHVAMTCESRFYAVDQANQLLWSRHLDPNGGGMSWAGPLAAGTGWADLRHVIADCGLAYAVRPDGALLWQRHLGFADGTDEWDGPLSVGSGWDAFRTVFSGCGGVIYGVKPDGELMWNLHEGFHAGEERWAGPKKVADHWQEYTAIGAACGGFIYVVTPAGELQLLRHGGSSDGAATWDPPQTLRQNVTYTAVFAQVASFDTACPALDALGDAASHRFEYPPGEMDIRRSTYIAHNGSRLHGSVGLAAIVDTVLASMRPGCTPIRFAVAIAGSDDDPRGEAFEDTASVKRAGRGGLDISRTVNEAIDAALARGDIDEHPFIVWDGGVGASVFPRAPSSASSEQRMADRFLWVRLIQQARVAAEVEGGR
jgi:hypothetical protein